MSDEEQQQQKLTARVPRSILERQIAGALRSAIHAHGPITTNTLRSATKRIIAVLKIHRLVR
jgi:hypothetical protein